jgi:hypothetical protein
MAATLVSVSERLQYQYYSGSCEQYTEFNISRKNQKMAIKKIPTLSLYCLEDRMFHRLTRNIFLKWVKIT